MTKILPNTVWVDGVDMSKLAWNISSYSGMRGLPAIRSSAVVVPGRHGEIPGTFEDFEASEQALNMWVAGSDAEGKVPRDDTAIQLLHDNFDQLFLLFGKRHALIDLRMQGAPGVIRQADAEVIAAVAPEILEAGVAATFTVLFRLPNVFWRDVATADWAQVPVNNGTYDIATLTGGTGPVTDSVLLITGPANSPMVEDVTTGSWVRYDGNLAAGEQLRIDTDAITAVKGAGIGWAGAGASVIASISNGGPSSDSRLLMLVPAMQGIDPSDRRTKVTVTGAAFTGDTQLQIRARRAFL